MVLAAVGMIAATAPLGLMGVGMLRAATERVLAERLAMARATADHLDWRLRQSQTYLALLGRLMGTSWRRGDLKELRAAIATIASELTLFTGGIVVADAAGRIVVQEPATDALALPRQEALAVLREGLTTGRPGISGLLRTTGGLPVVLVTAPLPGPGARPPGVVAGIINLADPALETFIVGMAVGMTGHAVIVAADGVVLASTDRTELFTREEHPEFFARLIRERRALVGPTDDPRAPTGRSGRHVMAFAPLSSVPWGVGVGQDEAETFGPIRQLRDRIVLFGLGVLAAALLFAWFDTGAVATPLRLLQEHAQRIAGGDLRQPVAVHRRDEVGALARSFEAMRVQLLRSLAEIERRAQAAQSLYDVGVQVLSHRRLDAVLDSVAARAASLLRADVAVVCLFDETGTMASVWAVAGLTAPPVQSKRWFPILEDRPDAGCFERMEVDAAYRRSSLAERLTAGGKAVGVLAVGRCSGAPFTEDERQVLSGLANLAAIAVEHFRLQERVQSIAVLEERERIAREMHDSFGQVLGYVNTKAQAVRALLAAGRVEDAQHHLGQLESAAREVYADLREAILGLRTETSPERPLLVALQDYVRQFSAQSGLAAELVVEGDRPPPALSPVAELHLIRIIQEALTNVRKHAMAQRVTVRLAARDGTLTVTVHDDGLGFDPARPHVSPGPRFGLQTMRERAEAIGGRFTIESREGAGTRVVVQLPLGGGEPLGARAAGG